MNKIMGGMSVRSRVVSGSSAASATRAPGVEAADVFRDILAAASSSSKPDVLKLASSWKCEVEQARAHTLHARSCSSLLIRRVASSITSELLLVRDAAQCRVY